jgi:hypothetical protein
VNRARYVAVVAGVPFIYRLYSIGTQTETCGNAAATFNVENWLSTKSLNFLSVRNEAIRLMRLLKNSSSVIYILDQSAVLC